MSWISAVPRTRVRVSSSAHPICRIAISRHHGLEMVTHRKPLQVQEKGVQIYHPRRLVVPQTKYCSIDSPPRPCRSATRCTMRSVKRLPQKESSVSTYTTHLLV